MFDQGGHGCQSFFYKEIHGLALSKHNICEISHKKLYDKENDQKSLKPQLDL